MNEEILITKYELELENFSGPLDKLLELIEEKELKITELSLADVTADFLAYLRELKEVPPRVLTDFISIGARLILIKSRAILPEFPLSKDEEGDIAELEYRLKLYQEFRDAEKNIRRLFGVNIAYGRDYLMNYPKGFYLSQRIAPRDLRVHMERLSTELEATFPQVDNETITVVSLEEIIDELMSRVDKIVNTSFNEITDGKENSEIVVFFLALLHLLKENSVEIQQDGLFTEIHIIGGDGTE